MTTCKHEFDLATARIKELEAVNVALIAERDRLKHDVDRLAAELDGLKNQEPVAYSWIDDESGDALVIGAKNYDGSIKAHPLYAKPIPPAIPEGMVLVPVKPTDEMLERALAAPIPAAYLDSFSGRQKLDITPQNMKQCSQRRRYDEMIFSLKSDQPIVDNLLIEIKQLNAKVAMLCEALQLLMDNQNGCPLPKYEADWAQAMNLSATSISATESDVKTWLESHDKQVRKDALEDVGAMIGVGATFEEVTDWLASEFHAMKGDA